VNSTTKLTFKGAGASDGGGLSGEYELLIQLAVDAQIAVSCLVFTADFAGVGVKEALQKVKQHGYSVTGCRKSAPRRNPGMSATATVNEERWRGNERG
jgi:hypothetical protein